MVIKMKKITKTKLQELERKYKQNDKLKALTNVLVKSDMKNISYKLDEFQNLTFNFEKQLETSKVTNQRQSGRCWIFAGLNVFRQVIKNKLNLETIELSQSYLQFYDNLEKSYFIMNEFDKLLDTNMENNVYLFSLVNSGMGDGGLWNMFSNLVKKYGIMPSYVFPDTINAGQTAKMEKILHTTYNKYYIDLLKLRDENRLGEKELLKEKYMEQCFNIISSFINIPPKKFDFEYVDKDKKYHLVQDLDPIQFYNEYVGIDLDEYVTVINDPRFNLDENNYYEYDTTKFMQGGEGCKFLNLNINRLKELLKASLDQDEIVWFGCDVGRDSDNSHFSKDLLNRARMFDVNIDFEKGNRLAYRAAFVSHAMAFTGYSSKNGQVFKWLVENSWGDKVGKDGFYVMSDDWFNENVFEIIVRKKHLNEKELNELNKVPQLLKYPKIR